MRRGIWFLVVWLTLSGCTVGRGVAHWLAPRGTRPVIKIGLVAPFEGRYRALGYEALYAAKWLVRERNSAGGVAGHLIELVALDDGDDPVDSAFQARKLAIDRRVLGVVGPFSEASTRMAAPVYHEAGLAVITSAICPPSLPSLGYKEVYCLGAGVDVLARALREQLPSQARVTLVRAEARSLGERLEPFAEGTVGPPLPDLGTLAFGSSPADLYLYDGDALSAAELLLEMRQRGDQAPLWGGPDLARAQLAQIAGGAAAGACYAFTAPLLADLSPGSAFAIGYSELAGHAPGPYAALTYDALALLLDALEGAIEHAGRPTREAVIEQLAHARGPDGELVFVDGQRRAPETVFRCYSAD